MNVRFRLATDADRAALLVLWDEAFPNDRESAETFLELAAGRIPCLVAESGGSILGMAHGFDLDWQGETYRYLYALAVTSACRRQGLGAALMAAFETEARQAGCAGILAVVMPDGPWGFYRKLGYQPLLRRRPSRPGEEPAESVVYPKAFLSIARAFGESPSAYRPDPDGVTYGVIKRFDGTMPQRLPFLPLTLE